MNILAVDTSGPVAGVALVQDERVRYEAQADAGLTHSETLMPMIDTCLSSARMRVEEMDLLACVAGPGSFTGVRIGVCAVRALSHASGVPCAQIDALETLAAGAFGFEGVVCPILDARRGQVYCAAFEWRSGALPVRLIEDAALPLEEFARLLPAEKNLLFTGDGVTAHGPALERLLGKRALMAPPQSRQLRAASAAYLARLRPETRRDALTLEPIYLRAPQAERERARRLEGENACRE